MKASISSYLAFCRKDYRQMKAALNQLFRLKSTKHHTQHRSLQRGSEQRRKIRSVSEYSSGISPSTAAAQLKGRSEQFRTIKPYFCLNRSMNIWSILNKSGHEYSQVSDGFVFYLLFI